jgi:hypothetical protein
VGKTYSPLAIRIDWFCEVVEVPFTYWISGEFVSAVPSYNSMQLFRLEFNHSKKTHIIEERLTIPVMAWE